MRLSSPRLEPLTSDAWSEEQRELLQPVMDGEGLGRGVLNVFTTLVRHPKLYKRWSVFANHVLFKSTLSARDREILILRTARNCRSAYEWGHHREMGTEAGLSADEIASLERDEIGAEWPEREAALVRAADELNHDRCIDDDTWRTLLEHFSEPQIMDAVFAVGNYHLLAMALNSFGVQLED